MHLINWAQTCSISQLFHHFTARLRCHIISKKRVNLRVSLTPLGLFTVRKYKLSMPSSKSSNLLPKQTEWLNPQHLQTSSFPRNPGTCSYGHTLLYKTFCAFQVPRAAFHHPYSSNCRWTAHNKVCPHRINSTALCILLLLPWSKFYFDMSHRQWHWLQPLICPVIRRLTA